MISLSHSIHSDILKNVQYSYVILDLIIRVTDSIECLSFAGCFVEAFNKTVGKIPPKHSYARFHVNITVCKRLCELDVKCAGIAIASDHSVFKSQCYLYNTTALISRQASGSATFFYRAHRRCDRDDTPQRRPKRDIRTHSWSKGNLKTSFLNICRGIQGTCNMFYRSSAS